MKTLGKYAPRRRNRGRPPGKSVPGFLKWLRGRECYVRVRGHGCAGNVRACHFDPWGDKGMGTKVSDQAALPMCDAHHAEQTDVLGWPKFQEKYGFDGRTVVASYWREWLTRTPMGRAWEAKQ